MKKKLILILPGLFAYMFLYYLWPSFILNVLDFQWYLSHGLSIQAIAISLTILVGILVVGWAINNRSSISHPPIVIQVASVLFFILSLVSVAIGIDFG